MLIASDGESTTVPTTRLPTSDNSLKAESESIEAALRERRILFGGFMAHMEDTRLPKWVMFGEFKGGPVSAGRGRAGKGVDEMPYR